MHTIGRIQIDSKQPASQNSDPEKLHSKTNIKGLTVKETKSSLLKQEMVQHISKRKNHIDPKVNSGYRLLIAKDHSALKEVI